MTETTTAPAASKSWHDWVNRTTAILAVLAALSSGRWGASNLQAILEQGKVNDTWAYYQADSIKEHDAQQAAKLARALAGDEHEPRTKALDTLHQDLEKEAARRTADKQHRKADAEKFQKSRDRMVERGFWFEISFAALQLGVILSTIASAAKKQQAWIVALLFGAVGLLVFINGIHPFFHAPQSWYQGVSEDMGYQASGAG